MNLPNKLTVARMVLVFCFAIFAFPFDLFIGSAWVALTIYVIASVTDFLDGYLARKNGQVTDFGKFLDPLADKLLVNTALISLIAFVFARGDWTYQLILWATLINLAREFAVSGVRMIAAGKGKVIAAGKMGKLKMATQTVALVVLLTARALPAGGVAETVYIAGLVFLGVATVFTVWSGLEYILGNRALYSDMK